VDVTCYARQAELRRQRSRMDDGSNVNLLIELADAKEAQRSYEANLNLIQASRRMISQTIDILRK